MLRHRSLTAAALLGTALVLASCSSTPSTTQNASAAGPTTTTAPTTTMAMTPGTTATADIVDTAVGAGSFTTLADLLTKAGLVDTLKGTGPFTVFAPTDEAFAKVPKATLDALAADPAQLQAVLTYHVVPGKVLAADVAPGPVETVQGQDITVSVSGSTVKVNDATVVKTDVMASNGVIHVIDTVLLPPAP